MSDDGHDWRSVFANLKVLLVACKGCNHRAAIDAAHSGAAPRQTRDE
jgi:hypothetical protein